MTQRNYRITPVLQVMTTVAVVHLWFLHMHTHMISDRGSEERSLITVEQKHTEREREREREREKEGFVA